MVRDKLIAVVLAGSVATSMLVASGAVYARSGCERADSGVATFASATVTIAQAITIAEQYVGGEAVGTGREDADGKPVFYVEVLKYGQKRKVIVDLKSGQVVNDIMAGRCNI